MLSKAGAMKIFFGIIISLILSGVEKQVVFYPVLRRER